MASLVDGKISNEPIARISPTGEFDRQESLFRNQIPDKDIEKDRYHLYVSYACPWAHRTIITRNLKKLKSVIGMSVTNPFMGNKGWTFDEAKDPKYLAELYVEAKKNYTGKITVPVLWDKKKNTIVNNESSEIIRIFNSSFDELTNSDLDLYPDSLQAKIDEINLKIYNDVNNGVYQAGFTNNQKAYERAYDRLFATLDEMDLHLSQNQFLIGEVFTEADIRFFTTLLRFDPVYYGHFKCNKKRISDYQSLYPYLRSIYQIPEVRSTCHLDHIKEHYYRSHIWINPTQIVPKGPDLDLDAPHDRGQVKFMKMSH